MVLTSTAFLPVRGIRFIISSSPGSVPSGSISITTSNPGSIIAAGISALAVFDNWLSSISTGTGFDWAGMSATNAGAPSW